MNDKIFTSFLKKQCEEGLALAAESDILKLQPIGSSTPSHFVAEYRCRGIVRQRQGDSAEANFFAVGIYFPPDYLVRASTAEVLTWMGPPNVLHPNVLAQRGWICIGRMYPSMPLVSILFQVYELITYFTYNTADCLDPEAAAFARQHRHLFPTDTRPLRRVRPAGSRSQNAKGVAA